MGDALARRGFPPRAAALVLAVAGPLLLAHTPLPQTGFYKDLLALLAWGLALATGLGGAGRSPVPSGAADAIALRGLLAVPLLLVGAAWGAVLLSAGLPGRAAADTVMLLAAVAVFLALRRGGVQAATLLFAALAGAALLNACVALLQISPLAPAGAAPGGRAGGWVRQSNVLALLMVQGAVALWAVQALRGGLRHAAVLPLGLLLMAGLAASGSRTGLLASGMLLLWGLADRRLAGRSRLGLMLLPLALLGFWMLRLHLTEAGGASGVRTDLGSPRWALWQDAWALIRAQPLLGVGWNNFNFAWTLSPGLPAHGHAYTHAHNLPLQLAVELGLPLTLLLLVLPLPALFAAWRGLRAARSAAVEPAQATVRTAALLLLASTALHSLSEFPLWHGHLLLLAAAWAGLAWPVPSQPVDRVPAPAGRSSLRLAGLALLVLAALGGWAQQPTQRLFDPAAGPLEARIESARQGWLSPEWGERLRATLAAPGQGGPEPFEAGAARRQLDARLLLAWAWAEAERGELERARSLVDRLHRLGGAPAESLARRCAARPTAERAPEAAGAAKVAPEAGGEAALGDQAPGRDAGPAAASASASANASASKLAAAPARALPPSSAQDAEPSLPGRDPRRAGLCDPPRTALDWRHFLPATPFAVRP